MSHLQSAIEQLRTIQNVLLIRADKLAGMIADLEELESGEIMLMPPERPKLSEPKSKPKEKLVARACLTAGCNKRRYKTSKYCYDCFIAQSKNVAKKHMRPITTVETIKPDKASQLIEQARVNEARAHMEIVEE